MMSIALGEEYNILRLCLCICVRLCLSVCIRVCVCVHMYNGPKGHTMLCHLYDNIYVMADSISATIDDNHTTQLCDDGQYHSTQTM